MLGYCPPRHCSRDTVGSRLDPWQCVIYEALPTAETSPQQKLTRSLLGALLAFLLVISRGMGEAPAIPPSAADSAEPEAMANTISPACMCGHAVALKHALALD